MLFIPLNVRLRCCSSFVCGGQGPESFWAPSATVNWCRCWWQPSQWCWSVGVLRLSVVGWLLASGVYRVGYLTSEQKWRQISHLALRFSDFHRVWKTGFVWLEFYRFFVAKSRKFSPKFTALARFSEVHLYVVVAQSRPSWIQVAVSS